jgi:hypothetical protein
VELALVLPLVALLALALLQAALVARDVVLVAHAGREAARAAAVDPGSGEDAAARSSQLDPTRLDVTETRRGDRVVIGVSYRVPTDLPLIGPLIPDVAVRTRVTIRAEAADIHQFPPPAEKTSRNRVINRRTNRSRASAGASPPD